MLLACGLIGRRRLGPARVLKQLSQPRCVKISDRAAPSGADAVRRADLPATFGADERLRALAARRRQLVDARQAERCRADLANDPIVRESLAAVIAALTQSLDAIEEAIERHIASDGELDRLAKALRGELDRLAKALRGVRRRSRRGRDAGRRPAGARPPDRKTDRRPRRARPPDA